MRPALLAAEVAGRRPASRGKVRDLFETAEGLVLVATDRISAFDHVLPGGVPDRGVVLTQLSNFWFDRFADSVPNHLLATSLAELPEPFRACPELAGRTVLARQLKPVPVECVVRGYLAGSGWREYGEAGAVCGVRLPEGLRESDELPEPIFTPATKETDGHDENIAFDRMVEIVGGELAEKLRTLSVELYSAAAAYARERGIIVADTKFEFGLDADERVFWIDEALTPDSSRFWPADEYRPGGAQPSFDKQFVRDWLAESPWDGTPPPPELPRDVVAGTRERYLEAYRRLTGEELQLPVGVAR